MLVKDARFGKMPANQAYGSERNAPETSVASALTPTSLTVTAPRITLLNSPHAITTRSAPRFGRHVYFVASVILDPG